MNYIIGLVSFVVVVTLLITTLNPQMHKEFQISDVKYNLEKIKNESPAKQVDIKPQENKIVEQKINVENKPVTTQKITKVAPINDTKKVTTTVKPLPQKAPQKQVVTQSKPNVQTSQKKVVANSPKVDQQKVITTKTEPKKVESQTKIEQLTPVKQVQVPSVVKPQPQVLTQQEETIAWNQWKANVKNQILSDISMLGQRGAIKLTEGCVFTYSFTVSKNRIITNVIVTASVNTTDSQLAVKAIQNTIRNYSGSSFLAFPNGSQQTTHYESSKIGVAAQSTKAKASDYSEYEKIKK